MQGHFKVFYITVVTRDTHRQRSQRDNVIFFALQEDFEESWYCLFAAVSLEGVHMTEAPRVLHFSAFIMNLLEQMLPIEW